MGRYYHLSKKVTDEQGKEIVREINELKNVQKVEITQDNCFVKIIAEEEQYADILTKAVNICRRVAEGVQLSFAKFAV